jgi:23S rRNA (cytosine1962-C5)-methyltransferase
VYALAGGATEVHSVDISKDAVALGNENVALNATPTTGQHRGIVADCFDYLRQATEAYDLIVLDPPAFAKNAKSVPNAARGYKDLNLLAFRKVNPNGLVMTYSCSQNIDKKLFQQIVFSAAADAGRQVRIVQHLHQPADHPINIFHPESEYLKGMLLWVE